MLARNSNGSTTLCSYGLSSDYKSARVELSMQSGSLNDPKNKICSPLFRTYAF